MKICNNRTVCYWCDKVVKNKSFHIDHYTPISKGGRNDTGNIVITCPTCNLRKNKKDPIKFANSIGKLL